MSPAPARKRPAGRRPLTPNPEQIGVGGGSGAPVDKAAAKPVPDGYDWETLSTYAPSDLQTKLGLVCELLKIEKREGVRRALEMFVAKYPPEKLLEQKFGGSR